MADPLSDFDVRAFWGERREHARGRGDDDSLVHVDRLAVGLCGEGSSGVRAVITRCGLRPAGMVGDSAVEGLAAQLADRPHDVTGDLPSALATGPPIARWIDRGAEAYDDRSERPRYAYSGWLDSIGADDPCRYDRGPGGDAEVARRLCGRRGATRRVSVCPPGRSRTTHRLATPQRRCPVQRGRAGHSPIDWNHPQSR